MDILTLTNTPFKKAWEVELREGRKDLHPVEHRGRVFTPWQSTAIVDYNSFSRPCGLLDIVSQCRRRALLLSLLQLHRIWCLSKFFYGLYFFRPCGLLDICPAVSETGLYSCRCFSFVVFGVFQSSSTASISFGPVVSQCRRRAFTLVVASASSYLVSFEVLQRSLFLSAPWPLLFCKL